MATVAKKTGMHSSELHTLCQNHLFPYDHVTYEKFLNIIKFHTLYDKRLCWLHYFYCRLFRGKMLPSSVDIIGS